MPSRQKSKGSSWERDVANDLSSRYGLKFVRTPSSGAYVGGQNTIRKESMDQTQIRGFKGDLIPPETWTKFNCELKNYGKFPFHQLIQGQCRQLDVWIEQLLTAGDPGDLNILIVKITRQGKYVIVQDLKSWCKKVPFAQYVTNSGKWLVFEYTTFWVNNLKSVSILSSPVVT